jgi:hypothetical protein
MLHNFDSSTFQLTQAIQKLNYNNQFFLNGGGDHRRIPSNPEAITNLHTQETHTEEEANMASVETKNIMQDSAPKRGGKNIERGPIINTGKKVAINKWIQSSKERKTYGRKVLNK